MTEQASHTPDTPHQQARSNEPKPSSWGDLALYLFGGMGLFILASAGIGVLTIEYSVVTLFLLALSSALFLGGSVLYLGVLSGKTSWQSIGLWPLKWQRQWIFVVVILTGILIPIRSAVALFFQILLEGDVDSMMMRQSILVGQQEFTWFDFVITFISVALLAPFFEELYFRGLLHRWFRARWSMWPAIIASSFVFGLAHFDSAGVAVSSLILGIVMAYTYEKTGSLWISIAIHAFNNGLGIILVYLVTYLPVTHPTLP
jgi:membrane protease YdiL (CAAX protease family)